MTRLALLWPALACMLLTTACSLFESDPAPSPTPPGVLQPQEPGPAPATAVPPGTVYEVAWSAADAPATADAPELELPLADVVPAVEPVWSLYVVDGESGEPRLLRRSGRWMQDVVWQPGGGTLTVTYFTRIDGPPGYLHGYHEVDVATGSAGWDVRPAEPNWYLSPDGTRFAVEDLSRGSPPFLRGEILLTTPGAETLRLDGFVLEDFHGWSPDGRYFLASGFAGTAVPGAEQAREHYLLQPGSDEAVLVGRSPAGSGLQASWSPDGSRIALVEDTSLIIFDVVGRQRSVISLGLAIANPPSWSPDGRFVSAGDGLVDADTGTVLLMPRTDLVLDTQASPGGAALAVTTHPFEDCDVLQDNRTLLVDVAAADRSFLSECNGSGVDYLIEWLSEQRFVLTSVDCYACDGSRTGVTLVTAADLSSLPLTEGRELRGSYALSPDRSRILVGGSRLRLYDAGGVLLREVVPPDGYVVGGLSWSPDGSSFTYIVGPADVRLL